MVVIYAPIHPHIARALHTRNNASCVHATDTPDQRGPVQLALAHKYQHGVGGVETGNVPTDVR
jgi:hypothetical protein